MQLQYTTIVRALNKAYSKEKVLREELDNFNPDYSRVSVSNDHK